MKLVVGLGNPGEKFFNTRHNVGFLVADALKECKIPSLRIYKSASFMNDSGKFVAKLVSGSNIPHSDLYVIHDDLDIPLGSYKIQLGKGPKDHNGINSVDEELGANDYWHVRVGIENRDRQTKEKGEDYVLQEFTEEEMKILKNVIKSVVGKLRLKFNRLTVL